MTPGAGNFNSCAWACGIRPDELMKKQIKTIQAIMDRQIIRLGRDVLWLGQRADTRSAPKENICFNFILKNGGFITLWVYNRLPSYKVYNLN